MDVMYTQGKGVYYRNKGGERVFTHPPTAEISTFLLFFFSFLRCARAAGRMQVVSIRNAKCRCESCEKAPLHHVAPASLISF